MTERFCHPDAALIVDETGVVTVVSAAWAGFGATGGSNPKTVGCQGSQWEPAGRLVEHGQRYRGEGRRVALLSVAWQDASMADLPKHPSRVDEPPLSKPQSRLAYASGRNIALAVYVPASVLTAPIVVWFLAYAAAFAADSPSVAGGDGLFLLLCTLVVAAVVHGGATIGLLTFALVRHGRGDSDGANGLVRGWICGVAANILFFLVCVLVLRVIAI